MGGGIQPVNSGHPCICCQLGAEWWASYLESLDISILSESLPAPIPMPRVAGWRTCREGEWGAGTGTVVFPWARVPGQLLALCPSVKCRVLHSSLGYSFHTRDEKQSLGRVYGYFPPNCHSWFTISGDKVWQPLPPQESGRHRVF